MAACPLFLLEMITCIFEIKKVCRKMNTFDFKRLIFIVNSFDY